MDKKGANGLVSFEEAIGLGLLPGEPPSFTCEWCGRPLEPLGAVMGDRFRWLSHRRCNCEESLACEAEKAERERRAMQEQMARRLAKAGIPRRYAAATTDNPAIRKWLDGFSIDADTGLYISGCKGSGKTMSASAIARSLVFAGYDVVMAEAKHMLAEVKATFGTVDTEASAIRPFLKCDLLIIDELGKESAREWSANTMFDIVNGRYKNMRPTIFCSQHRLDKLASHLSRNGEMETAEAIVSRIRETCPEVWLGNIDRRARARL